jgi:hypothetical protein
MIMQGSVENLNPTIQNDLWIRVRLHYVTELELHPCREWH